MAILKWQKRYDTHIEVLDQQRRKMFDMINRIEESYTNPDIQREISALLQTLVDYTKFHFNEEEKIMRQLNFKAYDDHRVLHADLIHQINTMLKAIKKSKNFSGHEVLSFLREWLINHILKQDRKIGTAYQASLAAPPEHPDSRPNR